MVLKRAEFPLPLIFGGLDRIEAVSRFKLLLSPFDLSAKAIYHYLTTPKPVETCLALSLIPQYLQGTLRHSSNIDIV